MLYSILPSVVQCRLPRLPSFCQSTNSPSSSCKPLHSSSDASCEISSGETSSCSSGSTTPERDYSNTRSLGIFNPSSHSSGVVLHQNFPPSYLNPSAGGTPPIGNDGDIDWKYAQQGLNLLTLAANEYSPLQPQPSNATFARQLYLHAITYLLRGLPQNLTLEEQLSIRSSLPQNIVEPLQMQSSISTNPYPISTTERSFLHRTLASFIVQLFIIFQFILPYFTYFLTTAYQYDREHKILQRGFAQGMESLDQLGKSSLALGSVVLEIGDGRVGQLAGEVTKWVVDGVAGGVQEGVGEVMMIVGAGKVERLMKT